MGELRKLYSKQGPTEGPEVEELPGVKWFSGFESYKRGQDTFNLKMGFCWLVGLSTYVYATRTKNLPFRFPAAVIMSAVPFIMTMKLKADQQYSGWPYKLTVEDRLKYYPITRRAFERALTELDEE